MTTTQTPAAGMTPLPAAGTTWRDSALCAQVEPDLFFPEKDGRASIAKKVCMACEVRAECLEYALANDERHGVWGGISETGRRKLRAKPQQPGEKDLAPCGTTGAYQRHVRRGEPIDDECREASRLYSANRRKAAA